MSADTPCHPEQGVLCWALQGPLLLEAGKGGWYFRLFHQHQGQGVGEGRGLGLLRVFICQFQFETVLLPLFRKSLSSCISSSYWYILFCVYRDVSYI